MDVLVRARHARGAAGLLCGSWSGKIDILCEVQRNEGLGVSSRVYEGTGVVPPRVRTRSVRGNGVLGCFGEVKESAGYVCGFRIGPTTRAELASHSCALPVGYAGVGVKRQWPCSRAGRVRVGRRMRDESGCRPKSVECGVRKQVNEERRLGRAACSD